MDNPAPKDEKATGLFSDGFYRAFRALFQPLTRSLMWLHITPNMITIASMGFGILAGYYFAIDRMWMGMMFGYTMGFADIVDGQLAKEYGLSSHFGGILDSIIDRYNEFFLYAGLGIRYLTLGRPWWGFACALVFLNSMMISYIKARAESDGISCKVGWFQRPERLTILTFGVVFGGLLLDPAIAILTAGSAFTAFQRVMHVYRQTK